MGQSGLSHAQQYPGRGVAITTCQPYREAVDQAGISKWPVSSQGVEKEISSFFPQLK